MTMRALLLADASSPNVRSLADGLAGEGIETTIASFEDGADVRLRPVGPGASRYVLQALAVRRLAARCAPDIVIGYFASGYGTLARLAGHRPLAQVVAGSDLLSERNGPLTRSIVRGNLRAADLVLAWSEQLAAEAQRMGVDASCVLTCPRGVDLRQFRPPAVPAPAGAVISTRSLQAKYRHDVVLRALETVNPEWTLTIVGDGPEATKLADLAGRLGDRVCMTGPMSPDDLAGTLRSHGVYVSACLTDGVSASLLEAMASGLLPVVVDNASNRSWIETGVNGLLHDGTAAGLAEALETALRDSDLRRQARALNQTLITARGDRSANVSRIATRLRTLGDR